MKKKLSKSGFTVVELIVSFSITLTIAIFLFQIIVSLKNLYINSVLKTDLVNIQSLVSKEMNKKFEKTISSINDCGKSCVEFIYEDNTKDKLIVNNDSIEFGSYKTKLPEDSYFKNPSINIANAATFSENMNNSILIINIPIYNDKLKNDIKIKVLYQYDSNKYNLNSIDFKT